jgi:hypothetical protein
MARLRFNATLPDVKAWKGHGITSLDDLILLRYTEDSRSRVRAELRKITAKNAENFLDGKKQVELDVVIDIAYRPRSLSANALMWSLYTLLAHAMDKENKRLNPYMAQELYDRDMEACAPRHVFFCTLESLPFFKIVLEKDYGHVVKEEDVGNGFVSVEILETSSYWDSKRMSDHIERILNELESMGITRGANGDVSKIFDDFQSWKEKARQAEEKIDAASLADEA